MKKLLEILGAVSLIASTPSLVAACSTPERIKSPKLNAELARELLVKISGNQDLANIDFGTMFNDATIEDVVVTMINQLLSLQYNFDTTNTMNSQLGFSGKYESNNTTGIEDAFKNKYNLESRSIAENSLFEEYTKSFGSTRLDYWSVDNNYNLNIQNKATVNNAANEQVTVDPKNKYIYIGDDKTSINSLENVWHFTSEEEAIKTPIKMPTLDNLTKEYQTDGNSPFWIKDSEGVAQNVSSKTALYLRFQDYFESKILEDLNQNLLTNSYLKSTMFDIKQGSKANSSSPYINPSSAIFAKTQSLNETSINEYWTSNVKMVWTLRFDVTEAKNITEINNVLTSEGADILNISNGTLKPGKKISEIFNLEGLSKPESKLIVEDKDTGYDSYFGLNGFQGLTIYNGDSTLGDNPISGKAYETRVKEWNKGPGIVKSSAENFLTIDSSNSNYADLVIVLPIYMLELLGASDDSGDSTYKLEGKDSSESSAIKFSNTIGNETVYLDRWNNINNKTLHSADVAALATDSADQAALLNQIMYGISKDSTSSDLAKTIIYSRYLSADDVYYAGLWDRIGTYIKSEEDADE